MDHQQVHETSSNDKISSTSSSHALLLPYPTQGHINPFMQLGKRLASQGVRVTFAIIEHVQAKIVRAQQQLAARSSHPPNNNFQILGLKDGLPEDFDREKWSQDMRNVLDKTLADSTLELIHNLSSQGRPVTCIVSDIYFRWGWAVAETAVLPEFIFWPQCASVFSIYLHVDAIISSGYDPYTAYAGVQAVASREDPTELISCIPGLPMGIHPADLPFGSPFGKLALEWVLDVLKERFNHMGAARCVIGNSFEALEAEVFKALTLEFLRWPRTSIRLVGPLVPQAAVAGEAEAKSYGYDELLSGGSLWEEEVDECKRWLDLQAPASVLFVAFGSITSMPVAQAQELALGLAASGHKFLWVVREKGITARPLADSGSFPDLIQPEWVPLEKALPEGFAEQNQHLCKVVRWAPQALVLSHPAVGGFFSHCGWNSTLESLCCGVPLLGWPCLMDQFTNCWLLSHVWKAGLTLELNEDNQTCRKHVESGVRQLMEGPLAQSLRARARELRALAREAAQQGDGFLSLVGDIHILAH